MTVTACFRARSALLLSGACAAACVCVGASAWQPATASEPAGVHWPAFRGPNSSGVAERFATPTEWDVPSGRNVLWKTPIPGLGHSSPVIWGERVFITTAVSPEHEQKLRVGLFGDISPVRENHPFEFRVICLDKDTGEILWERTAHTGVPKIRRHTKATHANCTPAVDGQRVVAFFGSEGLYAYDLGGELLWRRDFGVLDAGYYALPGAQWGFASSPVLHDGKVIVQCDVQKNSFVAVLDARDGRELWRAAREEVPTWCTPLVVGEGGSAQVVLNGCKHMGAYELSTGKEIWRMAGGGGIPVPTPVFAHGLIFLTSNHSPIRPGDPMQPIFAVKASARGEIAFEGDPPRHEHLAWVRPRRGSYMQTPLAFGEYVYFCNDNGILTCYEARTGEQKWRQRLGDGGKGFTASGVAADGKLYYTSEEGEVYVLRAGPEFEQLARNQTEEVCMATPAISEGRLFFRTQGHVVAVGE